MSQAALAKKVEEAFDTTTEDADALMRDGLLEAIHKVQAVIEFELDGTIRSANPNFLGATASIRSRAVTIPCSWSRPMPPAMNTAPSGRN
jgi:hypothetical protein